MEERSIDNETESGNLASHWETLMRSYPSDGWDGAAAQIARHDQEVRLTEMRLDLEQPDWREQELPFQPRTRQKED